MGVGPLASVRRLEEPPRPAVRAERGEKGQVYEEGELCSLAAQLGNRRRGGRLRAECLSNPSDSPDAQGAH